MPQIVIELNPEQAQRLLDAFRDETANPTATQADIEQRLKSILKDIVTASERRATPVAAFDL